MLPTIFLIIFCLVLLVGTFRISAVVTERTCCDWVVALWSSVASVIVVEFLTIGGGFFIRQISALRGPPDFMVVILMPSLTGTVYLLGYFWVLLFDIDIGPESEVEA